MNRSTEDPPCPPTQPTAPATAHPSLDEAARALPRYRPDALPVDTARALATAFVRPVAGTEPVGLAQAPGRVLAADLVSPIDVPAHDNSAMDGYAVRSADLSPDGPTRLQVVGTALAGRPLDGGVGAGQAARIMTGAVMPAGCDTVGMPEVAAVDGPDVRVPPGQQAGQHRRLRGEDRGAGGCARAAGRRLRAADVGLAASLGVARLSVRRRLRVAYFSTGDELCAPGEPLAAGCVYDSNRHTLGALLARLGVEAIDLGIVRDEPQALEAAMREAAGRADAVISSGGVSVGEADHTRALLARLGDVAFWTVAMRPGRPMAFGRVGDAYYFGLPGNPVAVMVTFLFIVRDALLALMGAQPAALRAMRVRSAVAVRKKPGRTEYQRALLARGADGQWEARLTGQQGSGVLSSMSRADCILVLAHDQGSVAAGDPVEVVLLDEAP